MTEMRSEERLRLLIVEGDRRVRRGLTGMLEACGRYASVEGVSTALEARDAICRTSPDVIVIDLDRPDAEAWLELIGDLRGLSARHAIAAMSDANTLRARSISAGADAFVHKWATLDEISDAIGELRPHGSHSGAAPRAKRSCRAELAASGDEAAPAPTRAG